MTGTRVHWLGGESALRQGLAAAISEGFGDATRLHANDRRSVYRITMRAEPSTGDPSIDLLLKVHHTATGRHRLRERGKRLLGRSPARREWRALEHLSAAGVPVPKPLAWGRLEDHDEILALEWLDGAGLAEPVLDPSEPSQAQRIEALARPIEQLHAAGFRHGDLHRGNAWSTPSGVFLLDLQHARRLGGADDRLEDLAQLELSLARAGWSPLARMALRDRLDAGPRFDTVLRRFLGDHLRGRGRRVLRRGRNWQPLDIQGLNGLRDAAAPERLVTSLLEICRSESPSATPPNAGPDGKVRTRRGGRARIVETHIEGCDYVVKQTDAGSALRALGDRFRGSPASRAFRSGQAQSLLSDRAPRALAYLEDRRFGLPRRGWLFLERVGDVDLDQVRPASPAEAHGIARSLGEWLAEGHAWGLVHRDLKGSNLRVAVRPDGCRFWWVDLEDLGGPVETTESVRLHGLAQLNASLADEAFDLDARRAALTAYLRRVPLTQGMNAAARDIARRSLARAHRWRGDGCEGLGR